MAKPAPPKPDAFHVYCDESQTTAARYMVFGGIITATNNLQFLERAIAEWRVTQNYPRELKWTKVSNGKYAEYVSLVDLFFALVRSRRIHFRALVLDTHYVNYRTLSAEDRELGFYKFYYHYLLWNFAPYANVHRCDMYVFIDQRSTRANPLSVLHIVLNHAIRRDFGITDAVKCVEARDSKKAPLLQLADVIMGAIGFHSNDLHLRPDARKAKVDLAHYIARKVPLRDLKQVTAFPKWHFKIERWGKSSRR